MKEIASAVDWVKFESVDLSLPQNRYDTIASVSLKWSHQKTPYDPHGIFPGQNAESDVTVATRWAN